MLNRLIRGLAIFAGAILLSQFPASYDQYVQRLGGHLDQARVQVERIDAAARAEQMTRAAYIDVFLTSDRSPVARQGRIMRDQITDLDRLRAAQAALVPARTLTRPVRFARHVDRGLAGATLESFRPGLPLSSDGVIYAAAGALSGLLIAVGGQGALSVLRRRRRPA